MILYPNAKINLGLSVVRRREDGYHDLETMFLPVPGLHDTLEIRKREDGECRFLAEGITVDCAPEDNLLLRTYRRMQAHHSAIGGLDIRFRKTIPFGAGLGGGSADAAFMAKGLNMLFNLGLSDDELEAEVSPLGADCAFFIRNRARLATGIGNIFTEAPADLLEVLRGKTLLLVKPDCAVSTGQAYKGIRTREASGMDGHLHYRNEHGKVNLSLLTNDFEQTVFPLFPAIAEVKARLLVEGALYAAMSGSGATVFGLFTSSLPHPEAMFPNCFVHQETLREI